MENLRCVVERITYLNEENGYTVLKAKAGKYTNLVTIVGNMSDVNVGSILILSGFWKINSKFGKQFEVKNWEETLPATILGIEKYLGSGLIKGIGPKYARKIVDFFGTDTLEMIETFPDKLIEIEGIGQKRVNMIKSAWQEQKEIKNIMIFLQGYGISTAHATKIFKNFGKESIEIVKNNPYKLTEIWGIEFKTADEIAMKMGFDKESYFRCKSGSLNVLNELSNEGHCFEFREKLIEKASKILDIENVKIMFTIDDMVVHVDLIREKPDKFYLPAFFYSENGTAKKIKQILSEPVNLTENCNDLVNQIELKNKIEYDEIQKDAIKIAINSKIMLLTGGPGTGKTTTIKGIISAFQEMNLKILLSAPTGRAAKRMTETCGLEAKTIHRLLEFKPPNGYQKNSDNPLETNVLIVDECSMIDIILMYNLLKAVPDKTRIIFVGDVNQLTSVGAGNVFKDLINSGVLPVVKLEKIFRQAQNSKIITNAHKINLGEFPDLKISPNSDFFFIEQKDSEKIPDIITKLCKNRLPKFFNISPKEIQVLCPMQRGECGAVNLNQKLQEMLNSSGFYLRRGGTEYRVNDKVMQIKNNYDKNVFNGDIGYVSDVDLEDKNLSVNFDEKIVKYDISELDELILACATTIHKAQGSEYPVVVMPITMQHFVMLQRNLLYTGITRAKRAIVLVGTKQAITLAVKNNDILNRNTFLTERLHLQCLNNESN